MVSSKEESHQKMIVVIRYVLAIAIISLMGAASMMLDDKAVIYPPAAAMLLGLIIKERQPWHVSSWNIPVLLTLSALVGTILAARLEAYPVTALSLGFLFTGALLLITEATLFPLLVSAGAAYMLLCTRTDVRKFIIHRMALIWQTVPW